MTTTTSLTNSGIVSSHASEALGYDDFKGRMLVELDAKDHYWKEVFLAQQENIEALERLVRALEEKMGASN